jgi:hypothetical protein
MRYLLRSSGAGFLINMPPLPQATPVEITNAVADKIAFFKIIWIEILKNLYTLYNINHTIHMSKKEGNPDNVIFPATFVAPENFEVVPYLNNEGDGMQDGLNEVEKNTRELKRELLARNSMLGSGNVISDLDFSRGRGTRNVPEI